MDNFIWHIPTTIHFGQGQAAVLGQAVKDAGGSRVLLAYGGGSIKQNGVFDQVAARLDAAGLPYVELPGIRSNPRMQSVEQGVALCREHDLDFVLAVGGGSVIDCCKAVCGSVRLSGPPMDLFTGKAQADDALPLGTVLTLSGTGSEMNAGLVITAGEDHKKLIYRHANLFPVFSILDPTYTFTLPPAQTAAGSVDIISHCMESYLLPGRGTDVQDRMNEGVMRSVLDNAPKAMADPEDYDARANLMWAASMALAGGQFMLGKKRCMLPVHAMGHELSSLYDMTHGVTLALLTPAWMRRTMAAAPDSLPVFATLARNVFGPEATGHDAQAAEAGVRAWEAFFADLGMPKRLRDAGVAEDKLDHLAGKAVEGGPLGLLAPMDRDGVLEVFRDAF